MCHAVRVRLPPEEAKQVRRVSGMMIPVYACLALIAVAAVMLSSAPRSGEQVAVANNATPTKAAMDRSKVAGRAQD